MARKKAEKPQPCTIVVFGASGDLTKRKLVPALYNMQVSGLLPDHFSVIGIGRREMTTDAFQKKAKTEYREFLTDHQVKDEQWNQFISRWQYVSGLFDDDKMYKKVKALLEETDKKEGLPGNYLFYLATPPEFFGTVVEKLAAAKLTEEKLPEDAQSTDKGTHAKESHKSNVAKSASSHSATSATDDAEKVPLWRRIVIEKPFGRDLDSAVKLNAEILKLVSESQVFRIDHYLGKETVQNLMVFRFANGMFEPIWNHQYIDHVQITVAETLGIETRADYYETSGALRDMVPNHLFQLLSLIGMEPPNSFDSEAVRNEKAKLLQAIRPMSDTDIITHAIRGQYGKGVAEGKPVPAYRKEEGVNPHSNTETFVAMKLFIDNWRWAGVPFYIRTGKAMGARTSEISIRFKSAPFQIFKDKSTSDLCSNELFIKIQPEESIQLSFEAKVPGPDVEVRPVAMNFNYAETFHEVPKTGYETLIYDAMVGDATLFMRSDQIESAWKFVTPILRVWAALEPHHFPNYPAGSWGPEEANQLMAADGRTWREIDDYIKRTTTAAS